MSNKEDNVSITEVVLRSLAIVGVASMIILAPNAVQSLKLLDNWKKRDSRYARQQVGAGISRAVQAGFIQKDKEGNLSLTKKGEEKLFHYKLKELRREKTRIWDGKWRLVMFDIKEARKKSREWLRYELQSFGFMRIQDSIWAYPYNCKEFVSLLKTDMYLGKNILYVTTEKVEDDFQLLKLFNLKPLAQKNK